MPSNAEELESYIGRLAVLWIGMVLSRNPNPVEISRLFSRLAKLVRKYNRLTKDAAKEEYTQDGG